MVKTRVVDLGAHKTYRYSVQRRWLLDWREVEVCTNYGTADRLARFLAEDAKVLATYGD